MDEFNTAKSQGSEIKTTGEQSMSPTPQNDKPQEPLNLIAELSILLLRLLVSVLMLHHGLEKLQDPEGFSEFVIGKYFPFLPGDPLLWTYAAALTQLICPAGLVLGILARPCALGLMSTMLFAIPFHLMDTGLEGFPLAVVENHNYAFELSAIYAAIFFYFLCAGPGKFSLASKK